MPRPLDIGCLGVYIVPMTTTQQTTTDQTFIVLDEYGVENSQGQFESVIVGEFPTKRAALKSAREFVAVNRDSTVLITLGHSQRFEDSLVAVFVDDFGQIKTEKA